MTYPWGFTSDLHLGHAAVLGFCGRPFADVEAMNEGLIARYNAVVPEGATVIWVGDAFMRTTVDAAKVLLARFHGHKILVRGNHDGTFGKACRMGFDVVTDELQLRIGARQVRVNHFPYANTSHRHGKVDLRYLDRRPPRQRGEVLIHGHTHATSRRVGSMIHVGVDAWDYAPVPFAAVEALVLEV